LGNEKRDFEVRWQPMNTEIATIEMNRIGIAAQKIF
jgi:hypothetical protein